MGFRGEGWSSIGRGPWGRKRGEGGVQKVLARVMPAVRGKVVREKAIETLGRVAAVVVGVPIHLPPVRDAGGGCRQLPERDRRIRVVWVNHSEGQVGSVRNAANSPRFSSGCDLPFMDSGLARANVSLDAQGSVRDAYPTAADAPRTEERCEVLRRWSG